MLRRIAAVFCAVSLFSALPAQATAAQQSSDLLASVTGSKEGARNSGSAQKMSDAQSGVAAGSVKDAQHSSETGSTKEGSTEKGSADFDLFQGKQPSQVMRSIMMVLGVALAALTFFGVFGAQIANLFGIRL